MGGYQHNAAQTSSPVMPEYNPFNYGSSTVMPIEPAPLYSMARPPPYNTHHHQHQHQQLQPLQPLIVPPQWPSMLTTQSTYPTPVLPTASTTTPVSAVSAGSSNSHSLQIRQTTTGGSTPRRTLTDDDRRRMCQYAEDNPGVKQTDIGRMSAHQPSAYHLLTTCAVKFGVERRLSLICESWLIVPC